MNGNQTKKYNKCDEDGRKKVDKIEPITCPPSSNSDEPFLWGCSAEYYWKIGIKIITVSVFLEYTSNEDFAREKKTYDVYCVCLCVCHSFKHRHTLDIQTKIPESSRIESKNWNSENGVLKI